MRLALALFGIVVGLLLAEGAARVVDHIACRDNAGMLWEPNRFAGWVHTPGIQGWAQRCLRGKPEWRVYTRINSRGLRDREIPYERQDGVFRVLVLGDSFTEAVQVPVEATFSKLLEQRLGTARAPIEVVNAGASGYGTDNELLFYSTEGWKYRPDLVLLVFNTSNDILENHYGLMRGTGFPYPEKPHFELEDGRLVRQNFPMPARWPGARMLGYAQRGLMRHSTLYRLLPVLHLPGPGGAHAALPPVPGTVPIEVYLADYPEPWRVAWRITRGLVLQLRHEVESRGSRFAVAVINAKEEVSERRWQWTLFANPSLKSRAWDLDKPNRLITSFLARRGIVTIPLLDTFRSYYRTTNSSGFFEWDVHWAANGHELAANAMARDLRALGLVPAAGRPPAGGAAP